MAELADMLRGGGAVSGSEKINVLIVGSGGREHALFWALSRSKYAGNVWVAPGNGGTFGHNVDISVSDFESLLVFARKNDCLTVVGPELPLSLGIVDYFKNHGMLIFGPTMEQALLETSKAYAKEFMVRNRIPTGPFKVFTESGLAIPYAESRNGNVFIKADGLCDGKGAVECFTVDDARMVITNMLDKKTLGKAGEKILVEDTLVGKELSVFALCDGANALYMGSAVDYKRFHSSGPNTGGIGSYSPADEFSQQLIDRILAEIVEPTVRLTGFVGILYAGLMITKEGPMVIEYNVRLGDPEAQVLLPRLKFDLLENMYNISRDRGIDMSLKQSQILNEQHVVCVVMCYEGYPTDYKNRPNREISGIEDAMSQHGILLFHAGTTRGNGRLLTRTDAGRIICVIGLGSDRREATDRAYSGVNRIYWKGEHHKETIGSRSKVRS